MTRVRRINVSQIEGDDANNTEIDEIRPFGEAAFYIDESGPGDKLTMMMFDGERTHLKSKVLAAGVVYGSNADSGDGLNYDTIKLIPDAELHRDGGSYNNDQYLIIDPTIGDPINHIHIRAGGEIDQSRTDLFLGGEKNNLRVSDVNDQISITTDANFDNVTHTWTFGNDGNLSLPGSINGLIGESEPGLVVRSDLGFVVTTNASAPFTEYQVEFTGYIDNGTGTGQSGATLTVVQVVAGTITDGMTIYGDGLPPEGWTLTFGGVTGELGSGGPGTYGLVGANILTSFQTFNNNVPESGGPKNWVFDDDGTLRLPLSNNDLYPSYINRALIKTFADIQISAGDDVGSNWIFGVDGSLTLPNINPSASPAISSIISTTPLRVTANGSTWTFNGNGNLTFPDNTTQNTAWTGTSSYNDSAAAFILVVDPLGDDNTANGAITKPFATIQAAHDYAANNVTSTSPVVIQVNPGRYTENITLTRALTHLVGLTTGAAKPTRIIGSITVNLITPVLGGTSNDIFSIENLVVSQNVVTLSGDQSYMFLAKNVLFTTSESTGNNLKSTNTSNTGIKIELTDCLFENQNSSDVSIDLSNVWYGNFSQLSCYSGSNSVMKISNSSVIMFNSRLSTSTGNNVIEAVSGFGADVSLTGGSLVIINSNANGNGVNISSGATVNIVNSAFQVGTSAGTGRAVFGVAGSIFVNGTNTIIFGTNAKRSTAITNVPHVTTFTAA
jgi:hypothetical protein